MKKENKPLNGARRSKKVDAGWVVIRRPHRVRFDGQKWATILDRES